MRNLVLVAALAALSACATATPVQTLSGDLLTVARQGATGADSPSNVRGAAMNDARAHCETTGKRFELVELVENHPPFLLGNFPRTEVRFRCV